MTQYFCMNTLINVCTLVGVITMIITVYRFTDRETRRCESSKAHVSGVVFVLVVTTILAGLISTGAYVFTERPWS